MARRLDNESWEEFCERVAAATGGVSWRWAAVKRDGDEWGLLAMVVEACAVAPQEARTDRYPKSVLAVEELSPGQAADRLRAFSASGEDFDPVVAIPIQRQAMLHRVWGTEDWGLTPIGWPRLVLDAYSADGSPVYADPSEPLSALGMTFYPSLGRAVAERVLCVAPERVQIGQQNLFSVRLVDDRGRIGGLIADDGCMRVEMEENVEGALAGFHLRLAWRAEPEDATFSRHDHLLSGAESIEVQTDSVPAEFFASLIDPTGEQVDQRAFDRRLQAVVPEPETLEASVAGRILEGEHQRLEYKQALSTKADGNVSFAETVAAFANGDGGEILIGIGDDGAVIGWQSEKSLDRVTNIIADLVKETPAFEVSEVQVEGKPIVVVGVGPSRPEYRPHMVGGRVMIRVHATTRRATPTEVRNLIPSDREDVWAAFPPASESR